MRSFSSQKDHPPLAGDRKCLFHFRGGVSVPTPAKTLKTRFRLPASGEWYFCWIATPLKRLAMTPLGAAKVAFFFACFLALNVSFSAPAMACSMRPSPGQSKQDFEKNIAERYRAMEEACVRSGGVWHDRDAYYKARPATAISQSDFDSCSDRYAKASNGFFVAGCFEQRCKCPQLQCVDDEDKCLPYAKWKNEYIRQQEENKKSQREIK